MEMEKYLERYEQVKASLAFMEHPEVGTLQEEFYKLSKSYKRMKPENFVKRADLLLARAEELRQLIKETRTNDIESEYEQYIDEEGETVDLNTETKTEPESGQVTMSMRGGARAGSGPKVKHGGVKRPVSITLSQEEWDAIDAMIANGDYESRADYFRFLHQSNWQNYTKEGH